MHRVALSSRRVSIQYCALRNTYHMRCLSVRICHVCLWVWTEGVGRNIYGNREGMILDYWGPIGLQARAYSWRSYPDVYSCLTKECSSSVSNMFRGQWSAAAERAFFLTHALRLGDLERTECKSFYKGCFHAYRFSFGH